MNSRGELVITSSKTRSQHKNLQDALQKLHQVGPRGFDMGLREGAVLKLCSAAILHLRCVPQPPPYRGKLAKRHETVSTNCATLRCFRDAVPRAVATGVTHTLTGSREKAYNEKRLRSKAKRATNKKDRRVSDRD